MKEVLSWIGLVLISTFGIKENVHVMCSYLDSYS